MSSVKEKAEKLIELSKSGFILEPGTLATPSEMLHHKMAWENFSEFSVAHAKEIAEAYLNCCPEESYQQGWNAAVKHFGINVEGRQQINPCPNCDGKGSYECRCCVCDETFVGYKRQVVCMKCCEHGG